MGDGDSEEVGCDDVVVWECNVWGVVFFVVFICVVVCGGCVWDSIECGFL